MNKNDFPKRKHTRLKEYDYSADGIYFVTICTQNKKHLLSQIVGRGLAPAVKLTDYGKNCGTTIISIKRKISVY